MFENLSEILEIDLGKIFSLSNLKCMKLFYLKFSKKEIRKSQLSWRHYKELLLIENDIERKFYYSETIKQKWTVRELHRQIENNLYYKLLSKTLNLI